MKIAPPTHPWRFFRAGGVAQVQLDTGADLLALNQLDQKLWVALACPATGLAFDPQTLALIDTDHDGRIRAPDLIQAVQWVGRLLKNPDDLLKHSDTLALDAINDATAEGQTLLESARLVLAQLGKTNAVTLSLADLADARRILAQSYFNGDGVIVAESAADAPTRTLLSEIITCLGAETDRSGRPGVNQAKVDQFFAECAAWDAWLSQAETAAATLKPLGKATSAAVAAWQAVRAKVEDYFNRCRLAAFDARALTALNPEEAAYRKLAINELALLPDEVRGFPLAPIAPGKPLPLRAGLNPAWAGAVATFDAAAVQPLLGERTELTEIEWGNLCSRLSPAAAWLAARPVTAVEKLGPARIREILAGPGQKVLSDLIARDRAEDAIIQAIAALEKLVRFHRDLHALCQNFVNFKDFYTRQTAAVFQVGTLYLDQRACELCLRVEDAGKHAALAALASTYLAYCDCTRKATGEKMQIVAAFTNGDADNLMVGRNGVFYDRQGRDWDATITKIVDNPISIRQAFWTPYKKLVRLIEEQVAKRAAAAEAASTAEMTKAAAGELPAGKAAPAAKKVDVGTVAALGVAFGALGTAFGTLAAYLTGLLLLPFWQVCVAVAALLLLISGPFMLIAWLKLRKRNLAPLLDANGWAINTRARINVPLGASLTRVAKVPAGALMGPADTFADRPSVWPRLLGFLLAVCFLYSLLNSFGWIHRLSDGRFGQPAGQIQHRKQSPAALERKPATPPPPATPSSTPAPPAN